MDFSESITTRLKSKNKLFSLINRHELLAAFIVTSAIFYFTQKITNATDFRGDARLYWTLSSSLLDFSFPQTIRGYFYPLILTPSKLLSEYIPSLGLFPFRAFQALIYALLFSILLPYAFINIFGGKINLLRRLIPALIVSIVFPGLISYPLSDIPALLLSVSSICATITARKKTSNLTIASLLMFAGFLAYAAYNTRTIYLFPAIVVLLTIPTVILYHHSLKTKVVGTLFFIFGITLSAAPQAFINLQYYKSPNPLVVTDLHGSSLFTRQLFWGITVQRYETQVEPGQTVSKPVFYFDPKGEEVFKRNSLDSESFSITEYIKLVISEPLSFLEIYVKHFVAGIDVRDGEAYTKIYSKEKKTISIVSISLFIIGLFFLIRSITSAPQIRGADHHAILRYRLYWLFIIILPVLAILPGAIETRFFLPVHSLAYCSIAFIEAGRIFPSKKNAAVQMMCCAIMIYIAFNIAQSSLANPKHLIPAEYKG